MRSRGRTVNSGRYSYLLARPALFPLFSWFPFWSLGEHTHTKKAIGMRKKINPIPTSTLFTLLVHTTLTASSPILFYSQGSQQVG